MSGSAIADRCGPASPPQVTWIVSAHVSGASARGTMQWASTRASSHDGPSGSADWMTIVRDGCRPVSACIVAAQRSASSGRRAMTTRFITLVRAATCRPTAPSTSVGQVLAGPDPGELALDLGDAVGARRPAQDRLADLDRGVGRSSSAAPQNRRQWRPSRPGRSSAASGPQVPAS